MAVLYDSRPAAAAGSTYPNFLYTNPGAGTDKFAKLHAVWPTSLADPTAANLPTAASQVWQVVASPTLFGGNCWEMVLKDGWKVNGQSGERTQFGNQLGSSYNGDAYVDTGETYYAKLTSALTLPQASIGISEAVIETLTNPDTVDPLSGFRTSGEVTIGDQVVTYTGVSGSGTTRTLTGCSGGTGNQPAGAPVFQTNNRIYLISFRFPTSYTGNSNNNLWQFKAIVAGTQASPCAVIRARKVGTQVGLTFETFGGAFTYSGQNPNYRAFTIIQAPIPRDTEIQVKFEVHWDWRTTEGWVKAWWKQAADTKWARTSTNTLSDEAEFAVVDSTPSGQRHATIYNTSGGLPLADDKANSFGIYRGDTTGTDTIYTSGIIVCDTHASADAIAGIAADSTAPVLSSATVVDSTLTLNYNETLNLQSTPATSDYAVVVAGGARSVSAVQVSGTTVLLTLASAVTAGQVVTVSYTAGTNPAEDLAGNNAGNLSGQAVTNNTGSDPVTLPALPGGDVRYGQTTPGGSWGSFSADKKRGTTINVAQNLTMKKIHAWLKADLTAAQVFKYVIYNASDVLVWTSAEQTITGGRSPSWHTISGLSVALTAGNHTVGTISGATASVVKIAYDTVTAAGKFNDDTYTGGAADPFGSSTALSQQHTILVEGTPGGGAGALDGVIPAVDSITFAGESVWIDCSEPLAAATHTATIVTVKQNGTTLPTPSSVVSAGSRVTVTLPSGYTLAATDTVLVTYAVPGSNQIKDVSGELLAAFTETTATAIVSGPEGMRRVDPAGRIVGGTRVVGGTRNAGVGGGGA